MAVTRARRLGPPPCVCVYVRCVAQVTASAAGVVFGGAGPYNLSKLSALGVAEAREDTGDKPAALRSGALSAGSMAADGRALDETQRVLCVRSFILLPAGPLRRARRSAVR